MSETADHVEVPFVADLVKAEQDGLYTELELFAAVLEQLTHRNIDAAIAAMPADVRRRFVLWARRNYDNEIPSSQFFHVGGEGARRELQDQIAVIREWLTGHREEAL